MKFFIIWNISIYHPLSGFYRCGNSLRPRSAVCNLKNRFFQMHTSAPSKIYRFNLCWLTRLAFFALVFCWLDRWVLQVSYLEGKNPRAAEWCLCCVPWVREVEIWMRFPQTESLKILKSLEVWISAAKNGGRYPFFLWLYKFPFGLEENFTKNGDFFLCRSSKIRRTLERRHGSNQVPKFWWRRKSLKKPAGSSQFRFFFKTIFEKSTNKNCLVNQHGWKWKKEQKTLSNFKQEIRKHNYLQKDPRLPAMS